MHWHGYLWIGDKAVFDKESVRRPPSAVEPVGSSAPDVVARYREAVAEWRVTQVPPLETAYWLVRPARLVQGTWEDPVGAARWLAERLAQYAPRFAAERERDVHRLARKAERAAETFQRGGDVSCGHYLTRPEFLSVAVVTCSPNRAAPQHPCPLA
ncbi:hypothetical protein [Streptomyces sp. ISL-11]|uniref:hypothetical protein n=1 Tax=Streptomyces sp. ISL-11 TaxID=2819174 RepID=UPI001BE7F735|nr:hypothetical protein [Streptomyces sp. ISL-11]MBT2383135.1 hypothetical protein [Streptomyces sp. ISL-11]